MTTAITEFAVRIWLPIAKHILGVDARLDLFYYVGWSQKHSDIFDVSEIWHQFQAIPAVGHMELNSSTASL